MNEDAVVEWLWTVTGPRGKLSSTPMFSCAFPTPSSNKFLRDAEHDPARLD